MSKPSAQTKKTFRHYLNTVILKAQECLAPIHCIKEFDKQCRSNIDTRQMVNKIMSDKVYAACLNDTTISVKCESKTKDPIIADRPVSLNGLKTPVGINGLTDLHCSILNQY